MFQHQIFFRIKLTTTHIIEIFIRIEHTTWEELWILSKSNFSATFKRKLNIYHASIFIYCFEHTTAHSRRQSKYHINTKQKSRKLSYWYLSKSIFSLFVHFKQQMMWNIFKIYEKEMWDSQINTLNFYFNQKIYLILCLKQK